MRNFHLSTRKPKYCARMSPSWSKNKRERERENDKISRKKKLSIGILSRLFGNVRKGQSQRMSIRRLGLLKRQYLRLCYCVRLGQANRTETITERVESDILIAGLHDL